LAQIVAGGGVAAGIETNVSRAARAISRGVRCMHGDVAHVNSWPAGPSVDGIARWDLMLLMPGRLIEMTLDEAATLRVALRGRTRRLLVYAYGDWITKYGSLEALCRAAGLPWSSGSHASGEDVEAALIDLEASC
jgi:hypothetical protein